MQGLQCTGLPILHLHRQDKAKEPEICCPWLLQSRMHMQMFPSNLHSPACCCQQSCTALQVSHHPPISAAHAENERWVYDIVSAPSTKFLGNSVEIYPVGARPSPHAEKVG